MFLTVFGRPFSHFFAPFACCHLAAAISFSMVFTAGYQAQKFRMPWWSEFAGAIGLGCNESTSPLQMQRNRPVKQPFRICRKLNIMAATHTVVAGTLTELNSCRALFRSAPRQTKAKKGQFMNFSQGHSGTKVQCEPCLFSSGKTPEHTKNGRNS